MFDGLRRFQGIEDKMVRRKKGRGSRARVLPHLTGELAGATVPEPWWASEDGPASSLNTIRGV